MSRAVLRKEHAERRYFIGGSDARIIMGADQAALLQLWREKRGEAEPEDLSGNLVVQLGRATEELNRRWYEANSGQEVIDVQKHIRHPALHWMAQRSTAASSKRSRLRGQVHAALVVLGRSRGAKNMRRSCSTIFGLSPQGLQSSR